MTKDERFKLQLEFILEADKIKQIFRRSKLFDGSRYENDAEHSWTICLMAVTFLEFANEKIDVLKVLQMLLIHDLVEVYAGDTFFYAPERANAHEKELEAAKKIFGILPEDQKIFYINLWEEFEKKESPEAKYATVFDRLEPILQNFHTQGFTWKENGVTKDKILELTKHISEGSQYIWEFVKKLLDTCEELGYIKDKN